MDETQVRCGDEAREPHEGRRRNQAAFLGTR